MSNAERLFRRLSGDKRKISPELQRGLQFEALISPTHSNFFLAAKPNSSVVPGTKSCGDTSN
jgi:hypothetical protein